MPHKRSTVKKQYIISYISVAVAGCLLVGITMLCISLNRLQSVIDSDYQNRVNLAYDDFENQFELMWNVIYKVKTIEYYQPAYKNARYTNTLLLMNDLNNFATYLPYSFSYYLVYRDSDEVFTGITKCTWEQLAELYLKPSDRKQFDDAGLRSMNMAVLLESGQLSVFMPFIIYDSSLPNNMCMIFTINEYDMLNRLATISGLPLSDLKLECDNGALTLHVSNDTMYHELGVYQRIGASMLVCILVALCAIAIAIALRNYQPISTLSELVGTGDSPNELKRIEDGILQAAGENEAIKGDLMRQLKRIDAQSAVIRQQYLLLVLMGVHTSDESGRSNAYFKYPYFTAIAAHFPSESAQQRDDIAQRAEAYDGAIVYAVPFSTRSNLAFVVNLRSAQDAQAAFNAIKALAAVSCSLTMGEVYDTFDKLSIAFSQATSLQSPIRLPDAAVLSDSEVTAPAHLRALIEAMREHDTAACTSAIDAFSSAIDAAHMNPAERRQAFVLAINYLSSLSDEFDDATRDEVYAQLAQETETAKFAKALQTVALHICTEREHDDSATCDDRAIVNFIAENALKYEMSLDYLTEHFALCGKTIGAAIKRVTGMRFREYLVSLRIEHAKLLLLNTSLPIASVAEMSGYPNVSYFNRSFKEATNRTPSQYRKEKFEQ